MYEFPTPKRIRLNVRVYIGDVTVTASDTEVTTVSVEPTDPTKQRSIEAADRTTVTQQGDEIVVRGVERRGLGWRPGSVRVTVTVPNRSTVKVRSGSGDIRCAGPLLELQVNTGSGTIVVDSVAQTVNCGTADGSIFVRRVDGTITTKTANGDIRLGDIHGWLSASTASGDIQVGAIRAGGSIRTASGDIAIDEAYAGSVSATTASGDIRVGVPAGVASYLDLSSASGRMESDLDVDDAPPITGKPGLSLRGRTASGNVQIHRVLPSENSTDKPAATNSATNGPADNGATDNGTTDNGTAMSHTYENSLTKQGKPRTATSAD